MAFECQEFRVSLEELKRAHVASVRAAGELPKKRTPEACDRLHAIKRELEAARKIFEDKHAYELLRWRERKVLNKFFGASFQVPPLPEAITRERFYEWREMGFDVHYVPKAKIDLENPPPGQIVGIDKHVDHC